MQGAETVLSVIRERGRQSLPLERLYRQLFNKELFLLAYGRIYSNQGAMTPGPSQETADGMSEDLIDEVTGQMRRERYRFSPARRVYIPKKNGKLRPLGMPSWSDKLVGEVVRLLLEAYYEPQFSDCSHGFRPGRGCHTALREIANGWTGTTWFIEGDISDCFGSLAQAPGSADRCRAADWAIRFYRRHGFELVAPARKSVLLKTYWNVPDRQIEVSVVLENPPVDESVKMV